VVLGIPWPSATSSKPQRLAQQKKRQKGLKMATAPNVLPYFKPGGKNAAANGPACRPRRLVARYVLWPGPAPLSSVSRLGFFTPVLAGPVLTGIFPTEKKAASGSRRPVHCHRRPRTRRKCTYVSPGCYALAILCLIALNYPRSTLVRARRDPSTITTTSCPATTTTTHSSRPCTPPTLTATPRCCC